VRFDTGKPVWIYTKGLSVSTFHAQFIHAKDSRLMRNVTKFLITSTGIAVCCFGGANRAQAFNFTEPANMDAGQTLSAATVIPGTGGTSNQINGNISSQSDVDLFKFVLGAAGMTTFNATPDATPNSPQLNINMYLFNAAGNVISNFLEPKDFDFMKFSMKLDAGTYFLGIGSDDMDVMGINPNKKGDTEHFIAGNDSGISDPNGVLTKFVLQNGNGKGESFGKFNIKIDTANSTAVPTPALLPGLIALGAGVLRKRKAQSEAVSEELAQA
jgi:hypothetical protein